MKKGAERSVEKSGGGGGVTGHVQPGGRQADGKGRSMGIMMEAGPRGDRREGGGGGEEWALSSGGLPGLWMCSTNRVI